MARCAQITARLSRGLFAVLTPGNARAGQPDAAVALAARGDSDVGTAAAHGHAHPGQRKVEMHTRQQFYAALKTEAQLSSRSSASTFCSTRKYSLESVRLYQDASERHRKSDPKRGFRHRYAVHETRTSTKSILGLTVGATSLHHDSTDRALRSPFPAHLPTSFRGSPRRLSGRG